MKVLERLGFLSFEDATKSSQQCNTINGKMENNPQWMHSEMIRKYCVSQSSYSIPDAFLYHREKYIHSYKTLMKRLQ